MIVAKVTLYTCNSSKKSLFPEDFGVIPSLLDYEKEPSAYFETFGPIASIQLIYNRGEGHIKFRRTSSPEFVLFRGYYRPQNPTESKCGKSRVLEPQDSWG